MPSNFFATVPVGAGPDETALWKNMKPLDATLLGEYWTKATPDKPVPNLTTGDCQQWLGTGGKLYTGMVSKKTGKPHGLVRIVHPNGKIIEQTCCDGQAHGLIREISKKKVVVFLYNDGFCLAHM